MPNFDLEFMTDSCSPDGVNATPEFGEGQIGLADKQVKI